MARMCRECGTPIDDLDTFCPSCEKRLILRNTMGCLSVLAGGIAIVVIVILFQ